MLQNLCFSDEKAAMAGMAALILPFYNRFQDSVLTFVTLALNAEHLDKSGIRVKLLRIKGSENERFR